MPRVFYSPQAHRDLQTIWQYIAPRSVANADRAIDRIMARCARLAEFPRSGPVRTDISAAARAVVIERWLALYRIDPDRVVILRIVDGAQDLSKLKLPE